MSNTSRLAPPRTLSRKVRGPLCVQNAFVAQRAERQLRTDLDSSHRCAQLVGSYRHELVAQRERSLRLASEDEFRLRMLLGLQAGDEETLVAIHQFVAETRVD
jgi:hypothetical protein